MVIDREGNRRVFLRDLAFVGGIPGVLRDFRSYLRLQSSFSDIMVMRRIGEVV